MEYWGFPLVLIGVIFLIVKLTQFCRHVGRKMGEESQDGNLANASSNIYIIEEDFIIIDNSLSSRPPPPAYSELYEAPPPYDPPPGYPSESR